MQIVVLISPTNSTPSQRQKHDLWDRKSCPWLTDLSLSLSLSLCRLRSSLEAEGAGHFRQNATGYNKRILPCSKSKLST